MLNQLRRIWEDRGKDDKDFTEEELKLKEALTTLKNSADSMNKAAATLLDIINGNK